MTTLRGLCVSQSNAILVWRSLKVPRPSSRCMLILPLIKYQQAPVVPPSLSRGSWQHLTSKARAPESPSAAEAAERGLRILRERSDALDQEHAMEAWHCLLQAARAGSGPTDVYFELGNLHYIWGDLIAFGRRAELGAEGAARAVVGEVRELRRQAIKKRRTLQRKRGKLEWTEAGRHSREACTAIATSSGSKGGPEMDHPEAWEWYLKAAEQGDTRAMMQLGEIAMESTESADNAQYAEEWYRKAAKGDPAQPDAIFQLARVHHEGIGTPANPSLARELYEQACKAGSSAAEFFLGHLLHIGDDELGIEANGVRALQLLRRASEQGHAEAMFYLAQAHRSGCPEMELEQDLQIFRGMVQQSAVAGSEDAMFAVGGAFFHGEDGFARDPRAAFRYYSAAAERGHADASYCLGVMRYAMGDLRAAFHCYETAAEGGNMLAWRSLASMYALGEGVTRSEQMANHILTTLGDQIERQESGGGEAEDNEIKPGDPHNVS